MRIPVGAVVGSTLMAAVSSGAGASPLIPSDSVTTRNAAANDLVLVHHKPWHQQKQHGRHGRHYGWVRGKHKGWYKPDRWPREQPRCMIEPWLCR